MSEGFDTEEFKSVFIAEARENLQLLNQSLVDLEKDPRNQERLNAIFRVAHTLKGMAATMGYAKITELTHHMEDVLDKVRKGGVVLNAGSLDILFSCLDMLEQLVQGIESNESRPVVQMSDLLAKVQSIIEAPAESASPAPAQSGEPVLEPVLEGAVAAASGGARAAHSSETIRVNISHLETLMNLVGELVINKGRLEQISEQLKVTELSEALSFFDRIGTELQGAVLKTRMVPVSHIFDRFPRMVRDVARKLKKEVNLDVEGADIEIDRILCEQISDPLLHILRNAIDHGIEPPEARQAAGKPRTGRILLGARREQSVVVIEVSDDGGGMSAEKLKKLAIEKGILDETQAQVMSDRDAYFLICDPRFSSAKEITDISGRGVGMDVVRSVVESFSGLLQIDSELGKGSRFTLRLPLSLAIVRALIVQVGPETYAIPLSNIIETVSVTDEEIKSVDQREVIVLRDEIIPLIRLEKVMQVPNAAPPEPGRAIKVVVVDAFDKRAGLVVDRFISRREIVVKTLAGIARQARGFSGATILGDGRVVLILDLGLWISEKKSY